MPTNLHLIEKLRKMRPVSRGSDIYESGDWSIPEARGAIYVGGMIYFHEGQSAPSYFGGEVTGFRMIASGNENEGRMVIEFKALSSAKGVATSQAGWGNEQKSDPPVGTGDA